MNENAPHPNVHIVKEDRGKLRNKGIKSPNLKKMPFFITDKAQKATFYFNTEEMYLKMRGKLLSGPVPTTNFVFSTDAKRILPTRKRKNPGN